MNKKITVQYTGVKCDIDGYCIILSDKLSARVPRSGQGWAETTVVVVVVWCCVKKSDL